MELYALKTWKICMCLFAKNWLNICLNIFFSNHNHYHYNWKFLFCSTKSYFSRTALPILPDTLFDISTVFWNSLRDLHYEIWDSSIFFIDEGMKPKFDDKYAKYDFIGGWFKISCAFSAILIEIPWNMRLCLEFAEYFL